MNPQDLNMHRAVFAAEGHPDTEARVSIAPNGEIGFTVTFGGITPPIKYYGSPCALQVAESLQYIVDTISTTVPGRLTPLVRGWVNTAADAHYKRNPAAPFTDEEILASLHEALDKFGTLLAQDKSDEAKTALADLLHRIMVASHDRGWEVAKALEASVYGSK